MLKRALASGAKEWAGMDEMIVGPPHYTWHPSGVECARIAEVFSYHVGSAIAYLWRHRHKGSALADLRKAVRHIEMEIERIERGDAV